MVKKVKKKVAKKAKRTVKKTVKKKAKKAAKKPVKKKVKAKKPVKKKAKAVKKAKKPVKKAKAKTVKKRKRAVQTLPQGGAPMEDRDIVAPSDELPVSRKGQGLPIEEGQLIEKPTNNLYSSEERQNMVDDETLDDYEAGFMEGYENPDLIQCDHCGKNVELAHVIEWDIEGTTHWFCSEECLEKYLKKKQEEML